MGINKKSCLIITSAVLLGSIAVIPSSAEEDATNNVLNCGDDEAYCRRSIIIRDKHYD